MATISKVFWCACFLAGALFGIDLGVGYRQDSLSWSIGGPGGDPNILSELSWTNLRMIDYRGAWSGDFMNYHIRFSGDYATILGGQVRDSDYDADDREGEFSRSISKANKGEAFDLSLGVGRCRFCIFGVKTELLGGVALQEQHLRMMDGKQVIDTRHPDEVGPIEGLHSNYRAKWYSYWTGVDFEAPYGFSGTVEGHRSRFRGTGHWNLRDDLVKDFDHKAWGWGVVVNLAWRWHYSRCLAFGLFGEYENHWTEKGLDLVYIAEGTVHQPLNRVRWQSARLLANITLNW